MSKIKSIVAAAAFALSLPAIAGAAERVEGQAKLLDPRAFPNLTQIYVASGVRDFGAAELGIATVIHCTNWTGAEQSVRFLIRQWNTTMVANATFAILSLGTFTASTHDTKSFGEDAILTTGTIAQGSLRIFATAAQVTCTAVVIDAAADAPVGVPLHLVRFNKWPGTEE